MTPEQVSQLLQILFLLAMTANAYVTWLIHGKVVQNSTDIAGNQEALSDIRRRQDQPPQ